MWKETFCVHMKRAVYKKHVKETQWLSLIPQLCTRGWMLQTLHIWKETYVCEKRPVKETYWLSLIPQLRPRGWVLLLCTYEVKEHCWLSLIPQSQHICQKRPICVKRDLYIHEERRIYKLYQRNLLTFTHTSVTAHMSKETYMCEKRPIKETYKKDLMTLSQTHISNGLVAGCCWRCICERQKKEKRPVYIWRETCKNDLLTLSLSEMSSLVAELIERNPPPPGFFSIHYVPWSRAVYKRFHDEMRRSHLVVKSLTHGSWSGNHSTKKSPRGGGFLAIRVLLTQCMWKDQLNRKDQLKL